MVSFTVIVAATQSGGIGNNNALPWPRLDQDMKFFRDITTTHSQGKQNVVVMGRKTWESLPTVCKPLPGRINVVISRSSKEVDNSNDSLHAGAYWTSSLEGAWNLLENKTSIGEIFVIGGAEIYEQALNSPSCRRVILTRILSEFSCDRFLPTDALKNFIIEKVDPVLVENNIPFQFQLWNRRSSCKNPEEMQYLDLMKRIMKTGVDRGDRTGTGTRSIFGAQMRFDLSKGKIPLITTRKGFFKSALAECLWLLAGQTDAKILSAQKVNIWNGNTSREFLDNLGFHDREVGDIGQMYGHLWRFYGQEYKGCSHQYKLEDGIDQIQEAINLIKNDPNSRRIVVTAWNPSTLKNGVLAPCHCLMQFYVANGKLSCQMYQRSADVFLGVVMNVVVYSIITRILCELTNLQPGEFIWTGGDVHLYSNSFKEVELQLTREPFEYPTMRITRNFTSIDDLRHEDFVLEGYQHHPAIKVKMAI